MAALWQFVFIACLMHFTQIHSIEPSNCPNGTFGDGCRFDCHCKLRNSTRCDRETGNCAPDVCDPVNIWHGPGCQFTILTGGTADQSNTVQETVCDYRHGNYQCFDESTDKYNASKALTTASCAWITPTLGSNNSWWMWDTEADYVITRVQVKTSELSVEIVVGPKPDPDDPANSLCAVTKLANAETLLKCQTDLRGRYIIMKFPPTTKPVKVCKVRVQGYPYFDHCNRGHYGAGCMSKCDCQHGCDHVTGLCKTTTITDE